MSPLQPPARPFSQKPPHTSFFNRHGLPSLSVPPHTVRPIGFFNRCGGVGRQYRVVRRLLLPVAGLQPQRQDDGGDGNREVNCKSSTMNIISNSGRTPDAAGEWRRRAAGSTTKGSPRAHPPTAPSTETLPEQPEQIANLSNRTARKLSPIGDALKTCALAFLGSR